MSDFTITATDAKAWSDAELAATIKAYLQMLYAELNGVSYNKAAVNRTLRAGPLAGRTKASIEFRMQNISAALYELKMPYIAGYLPARNIGSAVKEKMISLLSAEGIESLEAYVPTPDADTLSKRVADLRQRHLGAVPKGAQLPRTATVTTTSYVRDPAVKAWVLQAANGCCEGCGVPAPFIGMDGLPYLEVHHVMPLSSHGSDQTTNAVALCPNCHRRCHYAKDRDEFKLALYQQVPRLAVEVPEPVEQAIFG
ncbi:HNH endonuclease [Massilia sp. UMI-21]|nr:HNH endonuclease [Massilia sp. UMI-21]